MNKLLQHLGKVVEWYISCVSFTAQVAGFQNKVTSQNTITHVTFVPGTLLVSAKHKLYKQHYLLKQRYEIGPRTQTHTLLVSGRPALATRVRKQKTQ